MMNVMKIYLKKENKIDQELVRLEELDKELVRLEELEKEKNKQIPSPEYKKSLQENRNKSIENFMKYQWTWSL